MVMTVPGRLAGALAVAVGPLQNPCTITRSPSMTEIDCTNPIARLSPGGVLVRWDDDGFPDSGQRPQPNTTVAGHPAFETMSPADWCTSLGGTETITLTIPRDQPDNWYEMQACLRAPTAPQQAQLSAMLRTVRLATGD
jgi:hypothetical protein